MEMCKSRKLVYRKLRYVILPFEQLLISVQKILGLQIEQIAVLLNQHTYFINCFDKFTEQNYANVGNLAS